MKLSCTIPIKASREDIWKVITDIDNAAQRISGIEKVDVLEKPTSGIVGFKWTETRIMFGKEATETMWITEAEENAYYKTRAESHGAVYISEMRIEESDNGNTLTMAFEGQPQTFLAKLMGFIFSGMMKGSMKKVMMKDLEDIKKALES